MPRPLCQEPGLLVEDIRQIAHREPEAYRRFGITTDYAVRHADPHEPLIVSRTHTEVHDGEELLFALLVLRRRPLDGGTVCSSEIALSLRK